MKSPLLTQEMSRVLSTQTSIAFKVSTTEQEMDDALFEYFISHASVVQHLMSGNTHLALILLQSLSYCTVTANSIDRCGVRSPSKDEAPSTPIAYSNQP